MQKAAARNLKLLNLLTFLSTFRVHEGVLAIYFFLVADSNTIAMTLFAVMHLSSSIFELPTGVLSDNIGRKKTLFLTYASSALAVLLFYFANDTELLFAGAVMVGFSMAMGSGTIPAFVYENLNILNKKEDFKKIEGKRRALSRYSLVIAGLLGSYIIFTYDIRMAVLVTLIALVGTSILSLRLVDIHNHEDRKSNIYADLKIAWQKFVNDPVLRDISLGKMMSRGIGDVEYRFRALFFAAIMPEWLVSVLSMLNNLFLGISMQFAHWFVRRFGFMKALVHVDIVDRVFVTSMVMVNTVTSGIIMNIVTSISFGLREIATEDLQQARYTKEQRATMGSLVGLGGSLIYSVLAVVAGLVADQIGVFYTMLLIQPALLISTYFFYIGIRNSKHS